MSATPFADLKVLAAHLRSELTTKKFVLLYAYNGTGKTRLSTAFKDLGKNGDERDTLAAMASLDALRQQPDCATCRDELRLRVWPLLAKPLAKPMPRVRATPVGDAYLDALQREARK